MTVRRVPGSLVRTYFCGGIFLLSLLAAALPARAQPPLQLSISPDLGTWEIGQVEAQLAATGGTGAYAWQVVSGTLPPGLALRVPPDFPTWFSVTTGAGVIGIA